MPGPKTKNRIASGRPRLWGKLLNDAEGKVARDVEGKVVDWLSLDDHCTDVASVFRVLCEQPAIERALGTTLNQPLCSGLIDRLALLAFLHDLGKCNHGFQAKADAEPMRTAGHVKEVGALILDPELQPPFLRAIDYLQISAWFDDDEGVLRMLLASVSHHGKPIELDHTLVYRQKPLWLPADSIDPIADIATLLSTARDIFPEAFEVDIPPLTATSSLQHRFSGLVMLADWLGSHAEGFFPFHHDCQSRSVFARDAAEHAVAAVGLNPGTARVQLDASRPFEDLFKDRYPPTPLQSALFDRNNSPILIAESDTGSGKTEAALGHFFRLFASGKVDSLYFALPTRVAARELYERVLAFAKQVFGADHPTVLLAVPGYTQVDGEAPEKILPTERYLWQDEARVRRLERAWSAERPKRFLAAPIAVGTVDQALMSVLQFNHAHLRAVCLERALLVVDEVHASDTYMRGLLRAVLHRHRQAGGRALLLSATLGADARTELLTPLDKMQATPPLDEAVNAPYPSLTNSENQMTALMHRVNHDKHVHITPIAHLPTPERILPGLVEAVQKGARVLIVLNTVARVIALLKAAEADSVLTSALFRVNGLICPHHGRFNQADRVLLDKTVSDVMGKDSADGPLLLIGSQTLEQSLDIDADWLVTDLCPMDVLLQRIGRLHRHTRARRPSGFESPRCTVLTPSDPTLESFLDNKGHVRGPAGLGRVYPDLRITRLTLECIGDGCEIRIPTDNRRLVEAATHPENLARFSDGPWAFHRNELCAIAMAHGQMAHSALIQGGLSFGDRDLRFRALGEAINTRLGLNDRRIPLATPVRSPFGQTLKDMSIPGWMAADTEAMELDEPPQTDGAALRFTYGGKPYRYNRLGLELDDER